MNNKEEEIIASIGLTKLRHISQTALCNMIGQVGSASVIMAHRHDIRSLFPDALKNLEEVFDDADNALRLAEKEMEFIVKKNLKAIPLTDEEYPHRLRECADSPVIIFQCGETELNRPHVISIVGTRRCTEYGRDLCNKFVADLKTLLPDVLIVSGLAYGIDICAHKAALQNGIDTVGVLAHGLDTIYPAMHRRVAVEMIQHGGGLLTEYTTQTTPEKMNFVHRNRIVAGLCDACIVVESAERGGSLITADLAFNYQRDTFAFPGRTYDLQSVGCNTLIRLQQASLLTSAEDFVDAMGWSQPRPKKHEAVQQELFPELTDEERLIVNALKNVDDKHINQLCVETDIAFSRLNMLLFNLEMQGIVKALGGARYKLQRLHVV